MKALILFVLLSFSFTFKTKGVDLSAWDENVNFQKIKDAGYTFVILRAGTGKSGKDKVFEKYYKGAKAVGLNVGAYWYTYAKSADDGVNDAINMLNAIKGKQFEYPIYYDIEEQSIFNAGLTNKIAKNFCSYMEERKYYCGLYSSTSHLNEYFSDEVKTKYDIWVAQYASKCKYTGTYYIWQYTSEGSVPGVNNDCDVNECYYDYPPLIKKGHYNGF